MKTKSIEGIAAENHKYPLLQLILHLTEMAIKQLITALRLTGTLRVCLLPQLSAKDLRTAPQAKHNQRSWLKTSPSRLLCPNDPFIPEVSKLQVPKKYRWGRTTTNSNTHLLLLLLCRFVLAFKDGEITSQSNNLFLFQQSHAIRISCFWIC